MITERIQRESDIRRCSGEIPVHNLYTVGIANERFLRTIKEQGKLLAASCGPCKKEFLPPKMFCPYCLGEMTAWKEVAPRGVVETFTVTHHGMRGETLSKPEIFAFVRLTSSGGFLHRLGGISPEKVRIGLKVEAVFKVLSERRGSILDIDYFRPL